MIKNGIPGGKGKIYYNDLKLKFEGEWEKGVFEGKGVYFYHNDPFGKIKYVGEFHKGKKEGQGRCYNKDGILFEGKYASDEAIAGLFNLDNGRKYIGTLKDYRFLQGTSYDKNGRVEYTGDWKDGFYEGRGIYYFPKKNQKDRYEGDFHKNKPEGKGTYYYKDGATLEGDFVDGVCIKGTGISQDGYKFEGYVKEEEFEGVVCVYHKGILQYKGEFKNTKRNGKGVNFYSNGEIFVGEFVNGEAYKGKKYLSDGSKYEGTIKHRLYDGKGKLFDIEGKLIYEGEFAEGLFHGKGIFHSKSGAVYEG